MNDRSITVSSWLPDDVLLLEHASLREEIGKPFEFQLDLVSTDPKLDMAAAMGTHMVVGVEIDTGDTRYFNGIVSRFSLSENQGEYWRYRATLRPWIWLLSRTSNSRIFQNMTVPDIVKAVFRAHGFSDFDDKLGDTYRTWEFLVQYRETDLNFVNRLLEQEGIYYFFQHDAETHTLVLADSYSSHAGRPGYETVPFLPPEAVASAPSELEYVDGWHVARQIQPGAFSVNDFNFETPRASLLSTLKGSKDEGDPAFEIFDYPGEFKDASEGQIVAKLGLQERAAEVERADGAGNARGLSTGALFTLADYPREDQNKEYLIISTACSVSVNRYGSGGGVASGGPDYRCSFLAMDSQLQFRSPRRTPKPMVQGPQTAIVVGQAGEEIWTDKYGRVKVQFHWDREGNNDEKSSCWVRVAQVWAGAKWGGMHIPRVGQEVIVDFLEGDPDRPIITGRVYNADNMPPYDLPGNATQSGIKSRSSKGGSPANFNELRFEDKKGSEQVYAQAEKDLETLVKNDEHRAVNHDRKTDITNDETVNVGHNRTEAVTGDEAISIGGNRTETVAKEESVTVGASRSLTVAVGNSTSVGATNDLSVGGADSTTVGAAQSVSVGGSQSISVGGSQSISAGGNQSISAGGSQSIDVGKDQSVSVAGARTLDVAKDETVSVAGKRTVNVSKDDILEVTKKLSINVSDEISITTGDATISMKKNGDITIKGKNITLEGSGKINVNASGDIILKGSKIAQN